MYNHYNVYFGRLCIDDSYVRPTDVIIKGDVEVPEITEAGLECSYYVEENGYRSRLHTLLDLERSRRTSNSSNHSSVEFIVINSLMARFLEEGEY